MSTVTNHFFLNTLQHLRQYEEVVLFANLPVISAQELEEAAFFLEREYDNEATGYPFAAPPFDKQSGLWAAQLVYAAAQLLLYRKTTLNDFEHLLRGYPHQTTASSILSADLSLRFLPDLLYQLKMIDADDPLIPLLEKHLEAWHYSAIGYNLQSAALDCSAIVLNPCMLQLYADRLIQYKDLGKAGHPLIKPAVMASLGNHAQILWNEFYLEHKPDHATY